jgi:ERCC4-related helicase
MHDQQNIKNVVTNLSIVYSEVETEKSTEITCFSPESRVYR